MYDCVIIGGGHNGLVTAAYLARAGWKVCVLERRSVLGGACVTESIWPGFRVSTASYVVSLLLPEIERDLSLKKYGYEVLARSPSSFTPLEDGRSLLMGPDKAMSLAEIAKFSTKDAERFPQYETLLERVAEQLEPVLSAAPAELLPLSRGGLFSPWKNRYGVRKRSWASWMRNLKQGWRLHRAMASLGDRLPEAIEILTGAARPILDRWFESDVLKGTLATDAVIGTFQPPSAPGTAYVLLHHVMGSAGGARGIWGYVKGGMGQLSQAIANAAMDAGAEIRTEAEVVKILVEKNSVTGVELANGEILRAKTVASNVDCHHTFERFLDPSVLPEDFRAAVARIDYNSASMKINLGVSEIPEFRCMPGPGVGPHHRGSIHFGCHPDEIERAYDEAKYGRPSTFPIVEMTIPSAVDPTIAPRGQHILSLFVQYAPYHLAEGTWETQKEAFAERCIDQIERHCPKIRSTILHRQIISPVDLEKVFGLTGGNIFQGAMPLHQLYMMRPVPGWADYRTPIRNLYLCGSAAHPGGGVMGACGRNASLEMLRDGKR